MEASNIIQLLINLKINEVSNFMKELFNRLSKPNFVKQQMLSYHSNTRTPFEKSMSPS